MFRNRALLFAFATIAAASSFAQDSGQIQPIRQFQSAAGVADDSRRFFPQINDTPRLSADRPENPLPPIQPGPAGLISPVPVGGVGTYQRSIVKKTFPGIGPTGWFPPDPNLAVGPTHIVQVVNSDVAWFNKTTGVKEFQQGMDGAAGFFGTVGATNFVFDPKCLYDPVSQRFIVLALEQSGTDISKLLVAVSDDSGPSGTWFKYRIEARLVVGSNTWWMDYPSLACNKDAIAVCGNMFPLEGNGGYGGCQFIVMKKSPMLTGAATTVTSLRDPSIGTVQVARTVDGTLNYIYGAGFASTSQVRLFAIQNLATTPTISFVPATIPAFSPPRKNAQSTIGHQLDSIDSRPYNAVYRNSKVYLTHNVSVSGSDDRLVPRWYQISTNNWPAAGLPSLDMAGQVSTPGFDQWMPAIGVNAASDVTLIFSRASSSTVADLMICSRKAADPPGQMSAPLLLMSSQGASYGGPGTNRWGDYFDTAIDPSDPTKFWGVGMIGNAGGNWTTEIQSWIVSTQASTATAYDAQEVSMYDGAGFTGSVTDIRVADGSAFKIDSRFFAGLGSVSAAEITYDIGTPTGTLKYIGFKVKSTATYKTTGMWWLYNWNTGQYDHVSSWTQNLTMANPLSIDSKKANLSRYISPSGIVKIVVRTVTRPTVNRPYSYDLDLAQLLMRFE